MKWTGRVDGTEKDVLRLHQIIKVMSLDELLKEEINKKKVCFVSFNSDEGVRRNLGRLGARNGWKHLKKSMASFPVFDNDINFYDLSEIVELQNNDLEKAQENLSNIVAKLKEKNYLVIILGGGHEVAYGTFTGIRKYAENNSNNPHIGIVNFDAHFDMRDYDQGATSGTMFLQIADDCKLKGINFDYNVLGIQKFSNTQRLFNRAKELGVNYVRASALDNLSSDYLYDIANRNDYIHLTICTDVFHITTAPGVSAPQPLGIDPRLGMKLIKTISKYSKNLTVDIAEINPEFDLDDRTSRFASSLIYEIIFAHFQIS